MDPAGSELHMKTIEFRVRPVTRYNLTRYEEDTEARSSGVSTVGEFDSPESAHDVAAAMQATTPGSTYTPFKGEQIGGVKPDAFPAAARPYLGSVVWTNGGKPQRLTENGWEQI